ncbi:hypothetical protein TcWFU_002678 [Taenia crassiceps]|uniref:DUF4795 domain-containing protein n=1 Tax=Taenia crassiceps TaxID=6207 RepID=A0ABR4Q3X2_9CEST
MMEDNLETFNGLLEQALGNPEPGAVNFNVLRQLISALLRHLNLSNASIADGHSTNPAINLDNIQIRLSNLEESINCLTLQSKQNEVKEDRSQRLDSIDVELQKTSALVSDLSEKFAALQPDTFSSANETDSKTISTRLQEVEQNIEGLSKILGVHKREGQITSILSETEKIISGLQQRIEQAERSIDALNKSKVSLSDSNAFISLTERVEGLNDLVTSQLSEQNKSGDVPKSSLKVCIESLKMVMSDAKEELRRMDDTVKNMQKNLANIVQEKASKFDLEDAMQRIEAKCDNANAGERNELKQAVNSLRIDVADVCQRVVGIERFIKTNLSRMAGQMNEKASKTEMTAAQAWMTSELQKFALRLKLSASNVSLGDGKLRDEAAGIRKKMILHCISCDRPLLAEEKRRGNIHGNYVDPPYIRDKDEVYDVYRTKRGTGGVYTTLKANEVKPTTPKNLSKTISQPQAMEEAEQGESTPQASMYQDVEDIESGEISLNLDVALPDETGTIAPLTSPKQSDDETDVPEF